MSNVILGSDGIAIRQGIYEESVSQKTDLGRFIDFEDGRRFRYCKCNASAGITIGHVCAAPTYDDDDDAVVQTNYGLAVGDKDDISVAVGAAPTANQYADGLLVVTSGTNMGQSHRIKKNTAASPTKIWLYDPIVSVIAAACDITLVPNKYLNVVVAPTTVVSTPIGVPLIGITTAYYFWAQTRGYVGIMTDSATSSTAKGDNVMIASTTPGAIKAVSAFTDPVIGVCIVTTADDEYAIIDLHLE